MIAMQIAMLAVVLVGCGSCVDDATQAVTDPLELLERVDPPRGDDAIAIVVAFYEHELGITMPPIGVRWVTERIPFGAGSVIGLHRGCGDIWITWWNIRYAQMALAHEIGHCARVTAGLPSDPNHLDADWWARDSGVVYRANRALAGAGL